MKEEKQLIQLNFVPDNQMKSLVGFARRARKAVYGFDAVKRAAGKHKLALVLVREELSNHTWEKLTRIGLNAGVPILRTAKFIRWEEYWGVEGYKIMGILRSEIGNSILRNLHGSLNGS